MDEFIIEKKGECVPVAQVDGCGNVVEVFCQICTKPMTQREHKDFFDKYIPWFEKTFKEKYTKARPNYEEEERKGD